MKTVTSLVAVGSLFTAAALLPLVGAALFAAVLFGLSLLALVGVIGSAGEHVVEQHNPSMDPTAWRMRGSR
jgi:hypothetical protein